MKKLLLSLFVWLFSLIWFWYCLDYTNWYVSWFSSQYWISNSWYLCFYVDWWSTYWDNWNANVWYNCENGGCNDWSQFNYKTFKSCIYIEWWEIVNNYNPPSQWTLYYWFFPPYQECNVNDPYTSLECQTEYNLIPVEDVDINYCVWNWLCPNECGSWTDFSWDLQYSNIYINSILHPWEENIFIDIPDYIQWDYSVTTWEFNVYVWSWYDMDYMNSIIKINSYRPTSSDFTNIFVSGLTLIFPYIFVLLLIIFMWKLIKRVFK